MPNAMPDSPSAALAAAPPRGRRPLAPVLAHIEAHLAESLPLESLAHLSGLSVWRFAKVFRERMGVPPHRYISQRRCERAQQLMGQGMPAARAATEAGFYDQSHMNRRFKRLIGTGPQKAARPTQDAA
jgi:transcriptional regulator GlxA family with amidase domain